MSQRIDSCVGESGESHVDEREPRDDRLERVAEPDVHRPDERSGRAGRRRGSPPPPGARARARLSRRAGARAPPATARTKLTIRGPHRDAIESSTRTIVPVRTADDVLPARPRGDRARRLLAAVDVGEHDDVRALRDDVLGGELRVAGARRVRRVGDVLQPEQRVDPADERLRRGRVEIRPELVVDGQPSRARRAFATSCGDLRFIRATSAVASATWPVTRPSCAICGVRPVESSWPRPGRARGSRACGAPATSPPGS